MLVFRSCTLPLWHPQFPCLPGGCWSRNCINYKNSWSSPWPRMRRTESSSMEFLGDRWMRKNVRTHPPTWKPAVPRRIRPFSPQFFSPIFLTKTRPKLQVIAIILVSFSKLLTVGARISSSKSDFHWPSWSKQTTFFFQHGCAWKVWICATFWELTSGFLPRNTKVMGPLLKIFGYTSLQKQTWLDGKSPFWIGATSSNVFFSIVMLVFGGCTVRWEMEHGSLQDGFRFKK